MEVTENYYSDKLEEFDLRNYAPVEWNKHVVKDFTRLMSKLPMMRNHVNFEPVHVNDLRRYHFQDQDQAIQEYLKPILIEISEIRNAIKELAPHLRNSQQNIQRRIFSYARNHTTFSRRIRSLRAQKFVMGEDENLASKSFLARCWYRLLSLIISTITPKWLSREKEQKRILEAFDNFYQANGNSFKMYLADATVRCKKLEILLSNLKLQIGSFNINKEEDTISGIAYQLRISKDEMRRWKQDIEYVWREAKSLKGIFCLLPLHNCWQAIFNIMTGQSRLNLYV